MRFCRTERNCCLECHFSYEEEIAFPHIPVEWQQALRAQHEDLQARGFPPDDVAAHARLEERVFRAFCPAHVCELIERDHEAHGHGQLVSRNAFPRRNNPYSPLWSMARV